MCGNRVNIHVLQNGKVTCGDGGRRAQRISLKKRKKMLFGNEDFTCMT